MSEPTASPVPPSGPARRRRESPTHRITALVAVGLGVGGVIAAGVAVDRRGEADAVAAGGPATPTTVLEPAALSPVAPGASAAGSTWYCAAGTVAASGFADHTVTIANPGAEPVSIEITAFGGTDDPAIAVPEPSSQTVEVAARSSTSVQLGQLVDAQFGAALIEAGPGEVVVEHSVAGPSEFGAAPCASTPSATWHVAAGTTSRDARELLMLFNPFPDDVIVDITFTTPEGVRSPPEFDGFVIPGQRVVAVDVGAVVSRHPQVAATITARSGRLVVERLQYFDGSDSSNPAGLALTPAAPAPALVWSLPDGRYGASVREVVTVYNPSDATAEVDVEVTLAPSDDPTLEIGVEPFRLTVAPRSYGQVDLGAEPDRVPADLGHATTVRSQNGVPVVAERWVRFSSPEPSTGLSATLGSPVVAARWLLAVGGTTGGETERLVVVNPSLDTISRVSISAPALDQAGEIPALNDVEIPVAGRVEIDIGQYVSRTPLLLVVEATRPVVVERAIARAGGGVAQSMAVPSGPTASVPDVDAALSPG